MFNGLIVLFVLALRSSLYDSGHFPTTMPRALPSSSARMFTCVRLLISLTVAREPELRKVPSWGEEVCIDRPQNRSQVTVTPASGPATGEVTFDGAVD